MAEAGGELVGVAAGAVFGRPAGPAGRAEPANPAGPAPAGPVVPAVPGAPGGLGVAVVPAHRRAGLGGALTEAIMELLEGRGVATVLLHAAALGRPVYERLGFVPGPPTSLSGPTLARASTGAMVRAGRAADLAAVVALDRAATGEDRQGAC